MKKEEVRVILKSLLPTIRKIVRREAKKIIKPLINEAVENKVNKILAEHFLQNIQGQGKRTLNEVFEPEENRTKDKKEELYEAQREKEREEFRQKALKRLRADENPMLNEIYSDISEDEVARASKSQSLNVGGHQVYVDDDTEGVDLSLLGMS